MGDHKKNKFRGYHSICGQRQKERRRNRLERIKQERIERFKRLNWDIINKKRIV